MKVPRRGLGIADRRREWRIVGRLARRRGAPENQCRGNVPVGISTRRKAIWRL